MLAAGQVGQRSEVPWSLVGPGWLLAEWATAPYHGQGLQANPPGTMLFLVDPLGGRYVLATGTSVPVAYLLAWSGDGRRALFGKPGTGGSDLILDLKSGSFTKIGLPSYRQITFSAPSGLAVITSGFAHPDGTTDPSRRFDLNGTLQATYPTSFPDAGSVTDALPLSRPDGTQLLLTTSQGFELVTNQGQPLTYIPTSSYGLTPGGPIANCRPLTWWKTDTALVSCEVNPPQLWLVPLDGTPPSRLANEGHDDAWQLSTGAYLIGTNCKPSLCLAKLQSDGTTTPVAVPAHISIAEVIGGYQDRLAIWELPGQDGGYLDWFDPANGSVTPLLGGNINGGSVNAALIHEQTLPALNT